MITEEQRQARRFYIGGSDVGAIIGASPYRTPLKVYYTKGENAILDEEEDYNSNKQWGNDLEPVVRNRFSAETNLKVMVPLETQFHPTYKFLGANVDGITSDKAILEIKCVGFYNRLRWQKGKIPLHYLAQCAYYAMIYGFSKTYLAVFFGIDCPLEIYTYERDKELEADMLPKLIHFWNEYVLKEVPPPPLDIDDTRTLYQEGKKENAVTATNDICDIYYELQNLMTTQSTLTPKINYLKKILMEYMKDATMLYEAGGGCLATWKNVTVARFDCEHFKVQQPKLYEKYLNKKEQRRFCVKLQQGENK